MKQACVIGWPITHSRSPLIHGYWLKKYGIDGRYTKHAVRSEDLQSFLNTLAAQGLVGCNVTVPHKEAAFNAAAIKDASAVAVGAANTIWLEGGQIACANTDTYGFMANLTAGAPLWAKPGRPVAILGAGGAARAIVYGFLEAGVKDIRVFNRSRTRAGELARYFGSRVTAYAWDEFASASSDASVVVNTTTLGMAGQDELALRLTQLSGDCVVADIVYVPLETAFLKTARARGHPTVGGLGMLLHQAVPGFEKWFGVRPDVTDELYQIIANDIGGA